MPLSLPSWLVSGAKFLDPAGCRCIYLGGGGFREAVPANLSFSLHGMPEQAPLYATGLYGLKWHPIDSSHPMVCFYKKEWHMWDLFQPDHDQAWFDACKEGW